MTPSPLGDSCPRSMFLVGRVRLSETLDTSLILEPWLRPELAGEHYLPALMLVLMLPALSLLQWDCLARFARRINLIDVTETCRIEPKYVCDSNPNPAAHK